MTGRGRQPDRDSGERADHAWLAEPRVRLAAGAGIVLIVFFVLAVGAIIALLALSNGHGASIDSRMTAMERELFAGSHAPERSLQTNIEGFNPQLDDLKARLAAIQTRIAVLPQLNAQIAAIETNTSPVARLPLLQTDVGDIAHIGLPRLTTDIGTVIRAIQPISLLPSLAGDISTVTNTLTVLPRIDSRIAGVESTLDATERHLITLQRQTSSIALMSRNLAQLRSDIDTVTATLSTMTGILIDVRTHVANLDRKFPGAPVSPTATARSLRCPPRGRAVRCRG